VATYAAVQGVMAAIEGMLNERMPPELKAAPVNGSVSVFGSQTFKQASSNTLALWLYRISIDPNGPGGYVCALPGSVAGSVPEVPLMLHRAEPARRQAKHHRHDPRAGPRCARHHRDRRH
jgi:hypothetical protein